MKQFQRWARRLRVNLARSWALTTRTHGQYFITIFVFIGIGIFAALHTMISMMITSIEYKQTGYLDLYLENTNICWRNESLNQGTNDAWNTRLLHLNCNQFQSLHELINHIEKLKNQTLVENPIHREIASKTGEIQSTNFIEESGRAIRKDRRFIFHGNCSHIFEPHSERRKDILSLPIDAASCYAISPSSANKIFSLSSFSSSSHQHYRCLPSFLIIGAMKSGTGELMKWLNLHPFLQVGNGFEYYERRQQLLEPQTYSSSSKNSLLETKNLKEVHYFSKFLSSHRHHNQLHQHPNSSDHRSQPSSASHAHLYEPPSGPHLSSMEKWSMLSEYLNYFPEFTHDEAESIYTFEKSPDYIRNSAILSLISEVLPSIKLILQLRNPAIRALSEFQHHCRKKRFIKLLSDVSVNNRTYFKGNVLKNSFQLKDFHNLDGIEEHFIVPDEVSNHSASFKTSDSYHPHQQHQNHDRFTVNSKDLPINAFISLPYPCSVSDMMTYFTQFDSLYSAKSTLIASSISNNPLKKNDSLVQTEGLKQKNAEDSRHKSNGKKKLEKGGRRLRNQSAIRNAAPEKVEIISNTSQVNSTHPNLPDHLNNRKHENLKNQGPVHLYHASREQGLKPLFIPASQHEKYPKEIFNGLYYNQLHFLFQKFPSDNVLILLQEDMLQNTFRTLRRIESFLSLPCYDYSQVAIVIDADHPPERKPNGVIDKLKRYRRGIRKVFGLDRYYDHHIGGQELFDRSSLPFQNWLNGIYKQNNQQLLKLIDHYYPQSVNVEQSTNSTSPSRGNDGIDLGNESKRQESFSYLNIKEAGWPL